MNTYVAFVEFEFDGSLTDAQEEMNEALRHHGIETLALDVGPAKTVQLTEPVPMDNIPNDPFKFPHIKLLMESLKTRGDRYAD